ncbi:TTK protein kinase [Anncaliia algerae PRA339]|uniref:TTK protein kinase n=1 Tax=Anncaliia algerae PRA339 TaxID=1288291 RepID=A0A059F362_9MICR|nr:TTK protein kinase [Anncaliia algerae PRA339]
MHNPSPHQILLFLRKKRGNQGPDSLIPLYYRVTSNDLEICEDSLQIYLDYISLLKLKDSYEEIDNIFRFKLKNDYYKYVAFWHEYLDYLKDEEKILREKSFIERKDFENKEKILLLIDEKINNKLSTNTNNLSEKKSKNILNFMTESIEKKEIKEVKLPSPIEEEKTKKEFIFSLNSPLKTPEHNKTFNSLEKKINKINFSPFKKKEKKILGEITNYDKKPSIPLESPAFNDLGVNSSVKKKEPQENKFEFNSPNFAEIKLSYGDTDKIEIAEQIYFKNVLLKRIKLLGKGGSSKVYLIEYQNEMRAIKEIKRENDSFLTEIEILERIQSDGVIKMIDYEITPSKLRIILEYGDTDLNFLIKSKMSVYQIVSYWYDMLKIVKTIHQAGIIHKDLKPGNFLLVKGKLKLIDFGISLSTNETGLVNSEIIGTINYMAPETLIRNNRFGKKSDVWSLGCILYEMIKLKPPFAHLSTHQKLSLLSIDYEVDYSDIPDKIKNVIERCLIKEYNERASIDELLGIEIFRM